MRRTATLFSLIALAATLPAAAHAQPVNNSDDPAGPGGCHITDKDGYDIPIFDGQGVVVDGKTYSCSHGTVTVSAKVKVKGTKYRPTHVSTASSAKASRR
jgi:hypothetical protein